MRRPTGYTLIEILIAFAAFSILMTLVYNAVILATRLDRDDRMLGAIATEPYMTLVALDEDFRNFVSAPGFSEERSSIVQANASSVTFWAAVRRPLPYRGVHRIRWETVEGPSGGRRLSRTVTPEGGTPYPPQLFLEDVREASFRFAATPDAAAASAPYVWTEDRPARYAFVTIHFASSAGATERVRWMFRLGTAY